MRPTRTIGRSRRSVSFLTLGAIQRAGRAAKAVAFPNFFQARVKMPRAVIVLLFLVLLLVGLMFFFSSQADEVPTSTIEVEVNAPANAN
jgi:hypothetical protein